MEMDILKDKLLKLFEETDRQSDDAGYFGSTSARSRRQIDLIELLAMEGT